LLPYSGHGSFMQDMGIVLLNATSTLPF
jgi:hypothetical protein